MDYTFLQQYWWFLVSLLGALLVFLLFVPGANSMVFSVGVYIYYTRDLRRSVLRLLPTVLQHQLRRCLLAVDAHPVQLCAAGSEL